MWIETGMKIRSPGRPRSPTQFGRVQTGQNRTGQVTFAIERGSDCSVVRSEPTIAIQIDGDDSID